MFKHKVINAVKKVYPRLGLNDTDIILASYPKSGNTWVRFIWLNMVSLIELGGMEIDFHVINGPLSAVYDNHSYGKIDYDCLPRLVKTHKKFDRRFKKNKTIYLWRNPGDVMISYYEYIKGRSDYNNEFKNLSEFIKSEKYGISKWCCNIKSWEHKADFILTYRDLKEDAADTINKMCEYFEFNIEAGLVNKAVSRSTFTQMRKIENKKGRPSLDEGKFNSNYKFTRKGKEGEWKKRMSEKDVKLIKIALIKNNLDKILDKFEL